MSKNKKLHKTWLLLESSNIVGFPYEKNCEYVMTCTKVDLKHYHCIFDTINGSTKLLDRYLTKGQICEMYRLGAIKPIDQVEIAILCLKN